MAPINHALVCFVARSMGLAFHSPGSQQQHQQQQLHTEHNRALSRRRTNKENSVVDWREID